MLRKRALGVAGTAGVATGALLLRRRAHRARPPHPVFAGSPLLIAHRGGAALAPENTLAAFRNATGWWAADMIELDVRATRDGRCVVIHDATVDRTTDGTGAVADFTLDELRRLDAGYRFTRDSGASYPFRGRGVTVPTFDEVLATLPGTRLTVEVKTGAAQSPLFDAIERRAAADRVVAAGMHDADRDLFWRHAGAISASSEQMRVFYILHRLRLDGFARFRPDVVQIPEVHEERRILTPGIIRAFHRQGVQVHVWTVNEEADMRRLLGWGVDGLVTDRLNVLGRVLGETFGRPAAPGHQEALSGP
ncbi:MAG: glycerophosphodiester phosphodiesterase [Longimicrobiales bacterium]